MKKEKKKERKKLSNVFREEGKNGNTNTLIEKRKQDFFKGPL